MSPFRRDTTSEDDAPGWQCAGCGEWNTTAVDPSGGGRQSYVEDCQVCCRPSVLMLEFDTDLGNYLIRAELE